MRSPDKGLDSVSIRLTLRIVIARPRLTRYCRPWAGAYALRAITCVRARNALKRFRAFKIELSLDVNDAKSVKVEGGSNEALWARSTRGLLSIA